ncbi:class A beta-lactamase-related serine hydrolase [Citricoccus sp. SGAir0253]|uniref:serine hydrolase domain-containing protein n=1 Tax=Citricoccus sp. SGAir0253 TaxID=2567881 RepID=UPI0010CD5449|nr:serine hydrolase domain-containing protein [Citricoccus sp. SGAir0253]QCU77673.1 class A beta-lactamase-related serine hydrolase [Citricoccus sp. SGAir0253]
MMTPSGPRGGPAGGSPDGNPGGGWRRVLELAGSRGASVQVAVLHGGIPVLDGTVRCRPDALGWLFSASKPFTALLVHRLARRGVLGLDDRVADLWPAFGTGGGGSKARTTVRDVLTHRTAVPTAGPYPAAVLAMHRLEESVERVAAGRRRARRYGRASAYQPLDFGFILAEVARRATGRQWTELLRELVLAPAGLADVHPGVPDAELRRALPIDASAAALPGGPIVAAVLNRRAVRQAVIPAAGISTTARQLALFYHHLLTAPERPALCAPSSDGARDAWTRLPTRWGTGVQLGGTGRWCPLGESSTVRSFGHNGSDVCLGWADPDLDLAVGIVTDRASGHPADKRLLVRVSDAIRTCAVDHVPRC